jgi:phosphoribosylamine---glycine ligase
MVPEPSLARQYSSILTLKILIIGSGGREHALAWRFRMEDPSATLFAAPGNPGIAQIARCVPIGAGEIAALADFAAAEGIDLTVVGPEAPLAAGVVDHFSARGLPIFGPTASAAKLESSKAFAKEVMAAAGVPTARAERHTEVGPALEAVRRLGAPIVVKASGLAAGKGVVVAESLEEAEEAVRMMLVGGSMGEAGSEILLEEFMEGEELSLFVLTDGQRGVPLVPAQDHKRLLDGDRGPNTGGMGAYAPVSVGTPAVVDEVMQQVVEPTLAEMRHRGSPFTGVLYVGLMLGPEGARVVEFNCRFGDPETQAVLPVMSLEPGLIELMLGVARGGKLPPARCSATGFAVTTVVAAPGYPGKVRTGGRLMLPPKRDGVYVFHAGTSLTEDGALVASGGRVVAVTAVAPTYDDARRASVASAGEVVLEGKQLRRDIGWREAARARGDAGAA